MTHRIYIYIYSKENRNPAAEWRMVPIKEEIQDRYNRLFKACAGDK